MSGFSITPVGPFPTANDEGFPDFIQFQWEGEDVGDNAADTVNFEGTGVAVTRGEGENANIVTVSVEGGGSGGGLSLQFQDEGTDLGSPNADTLNFTGTGVSAARAGDTVTVTVAGLSWRDVPGDYTLVPSDNNNGLATSGTTGTQSITVPANADVAFAQGAVVLVFAEGAAGVTIVGASGVTLAYRADFLPSAAGQYATLTIIKRSTNLWLVCGDMASA